jgi:glycosyltransferase involved in cell wall biosynthesis
MDKNLNIITSSSPLGGGQEGALPISVIIPLQEKRKEFFYQFTLPLLKASQPAEIIINDGPGNAAVKRNQGFKVSRQPFILFLDDDKLLPRDYLSVLHHTLEQHPDIDFVYTGYTGIVLHPNTHPCKGNYRIRTKEFDVKSLKSANYIDTTSLMRRDAFAGFDETIPQHDDWELYLHMATNGKKGKAVHGLEFFSFFLDEGITSVNNKDCSTIIRDRYK